MSSGGVRVGIAFDDHAFASSPTYTYLAGVVRCESDRGREYEFEQTQPGIATVVLVDPNGDYDPTNPGSPYSGKLDPSKPAVIDLYDPVAAAWVRQFTGFTHEWAASLNLEENNFDVTLTLVDGFDLLARLEMHPDLHTNTNPDFGTTVPAGSEGDIYYDGMGGANGGTLDHVGPDDRINQALDDAQWPAGSSWRELFTGNVAMQDNVYARRDQLMSVLFDAADAEFPGVSNLFMTKAGKVAFRGRFARFNPANSNYSGFIDFWSCGDTAAATAGTAVAVIAGLEFRRSADDIYNEALALPDGVEESDVPTAYVSDGTSISTHGPRTRTYTDLLVYKGEESPSHTPRGRGGPARRRSASPRR